MLQQMHMMLCSKPKLKKNVVIYQDKLWVVAAYLDDGRAGMSPDILDSFCAGCLKSFGVIV